MRKASAVRKRFVLLLFITGITVLTGTLPNRPVAAQQTPSVPPAEPQPSLLEKLNAFSRLIAQRINFSGSTGNALTRMEEVRAVALDYPAETKPQEYSLLTTFLKHYSAALGNYEDALHFDDVTARKYPDDPSVEKALAGYRPVPAAAAISDAAAPRQIVLVNEAHHVPQHRAFTIELLKSLKKKGYTYFAAEALYNSEAEPNRADTELGRRGYPTKKTGNYMDEPVYGDAIRTALRLGYKVVPYDAGFSRTGQINTSAAREREAAENLKNRIFKVDPRAKVLIHVGYDHSSEAANVYGNSPGLAGLLKELTGIDPLTVDQTRMSEHSAPEYEPPLYRVVAARKGFSQPMAFRDPQGKFWKPEGSGQDITVFSPRSRYSSGRPTWLQLNGARKHYLLPTDVCGTETACLVRARFATESEDAVPIDQVEVRAGVATSLLLPKGTFVVDVETASGKRVKTWRVTR
jgi:hypothetical protein